MTDKHFVLKLFLRIFSVILPIIAIIAYMNIVVVHELEVDIKHVVVHSFVALFFSSLLTLAVYPMLKKIRILEYEKYQKHLKVLEQEKKILSKNKKEMMGDMIENIAHQWRQPIASIEAVLAIISSKKQLGQLEDHIVEKNIERVQAYTKYMTETITDFRDFFKIEKEYVPFSLLEVIRLCEHILFAALKEKSIYLDIKSDDILCDGLKNELLQALIIIVKNAIDASDYNDASIHIHGFSHESDVIVEIEDTAGGIDTEILPKLFEKGSSTKLGSGGTGIGLSMAKTMIEDHMQGSLEARNGEAGAIFTMVFPQHLRRA